VNSTSPEITLQATAQPFSADMLELRLIQENPEALKQMLSRRRHEGVAVSELLKLIEESKEIRARSEALRADRNRISKEIGILIGQGKKDEAEVQKEEVRRIGDEIALLEKRLEEVLSQQNEIILALPNWIDEDVPDGADATANLTVKTVGEIPRFDFQPLPHYEIGERLGILDFERGAKLAGSRFYTYRDLAARLERAIINFMLDLHTEKNGYTEMWVPMLVNDQCMMTTGQYPKFRGEYYQLERDGLSLIPTAEVPLVNLYYDEIIAEEELPIAVTAATSCFRREAGAAGRDTRGLVRVHQFQKVELVRITHPNTSAKEHEQMLAHAESVLSALKLPYRVLLLCSGDMGATARKTYDIEVWMPGLNRWLEISSVSNCGDYQARRGKIRIKTKDGNIYAHTLNGSGLAAGRTMIAIMENYQKADGTFDIPEVLKKYL
jgi:seryl-tRNA synthetase